MYCTFFSDEIQIVPSFSVSLSKSGSLFTLLRWNTKCTLSLVKRISSLKRGRVWNLISSLWRSSQLDAMIYRFLLLCWRGMLHSYLSYEIKIHFIEKNQFIFFPFPSRREGRVGFAEYQEIFLLYHRIFSSHKHSLNFIWWRNMVCYGPQVKYIQWPYSAHSHIRPFLLLLLLDFSCCLSWLIFPLTVLNVLHEVS